MGQEPATYILPIETERTALHACNYEYMLNMKLDLQSGFGLLYSLAETPQLPPSPRIWAHIQGLYWSAKSDDISM